LPQNSKQSSRKLDRTRLQGPLRLYLMFNLYAKIWIELTERVERMCDDVWKMLNAAMLEGDQMYWTSPWHPWSYLMARYTEIVSDVCMGTFEYNWLSEWKGCAMMFERCWMRQCLEATQM
jgi:hypothetical protein